MPVLSARARWVVPGAVALAVAGTAGVVAMSADATPSLPPRTPAQLLVDLQTAKLTDMSGTVRETADLGLPALPKVGGNTDLTQLASGSNTVRVWYAGPTRVRLAVLGPLGESDLIRNGSDVWTWNSDHNTYTHDTLAPGHEKDALPPHLPARLPRTPQEAADQVLAMVSQTTDVSTDGTAMVAHRRAYELVLRPKDGRSLVGQVRIAVDAEHHVPLRVRVFAKGANSPAFEVGFTQISFSTPGDEQFRFVPPKGATLDTGRPDGALPGRRSSSQAAPGTPQRTAPDKPGGQPAARPKVVGSGWTAVVVVSGQGQSAGGQLGALLGQLPRVTGPWGSGRELRGALFTVVLADDGRIAVGAVAPQLVYQALGAR